MRSTLQLAGSFYGTIGWRFYAVANKGSSLKLVQLLQLARSSSTGYYGRCWCIPVCSRQVPKRPSLPRQVLTSPPSSPCVMMCGWSILWWFLNSSEGVLFFLVFSLGLFVIWIAFRITCNREKSSNKYWYFRLRCMQSWRSVEGARVG